MASTSDSTSGVLMQVSNVAHKQPRESKPHLFSLKLYKGQLYASIDPSECSWQMGTFAVTAPHPHAPALLSLKSTVKHPPNTENGEDGERYIWLSLQKVEKTEKNQHWNCVVDGDPKIDTSRFGVQAMSLNVNDPDSMKRAIQKFKATVRKDQKHKH